MENFYKINEDYAEIILNKRIYPLLTIKKAIVNFMQDIYIKINHFNENEYKIQINLKETDKDIEEIIGEFYNELLRESLRYTIAKETKNLRELIVGRALYTTCIDTEEDGVKTENEEILDNSEKIEMQDYSLDEIAVNWFEKYKNKEE